MSNKNYVNHVLNDSTEITEEQVDTKEESAVVMLGVVTDCLRLNIRSAPAMDAPIITTVTCFTELLVSPEASSDEWYAVCTAAGVEGFCMKKYVAIRQ